MNNGVKRYASESQLDWELLKNRPFYTTDPIETILVENYSAEVVDTFQPIVDPFSFELVEGSTYIVTWDDVTYECAAYKPQEFAPVCIGNASLVGIEGFGNEEPFCITTGVNAAPLSIDDTYTNPMLLFASTSGTHTVKIVNVVRDIVKLDEKYLPDNIQSDWNQNDESQLDYVKNRTHYITDEEIVLYEWDGSTDGYEVFTNSSDTYHAVRLGDSISKEELNGTFIVSGFTDVTPEELWTDEISSEYLTDMAENVFTDEMTFVVTLEDNASANGISYGKAGFYAIVEGRYDGQFRKLYKNKIVKLDEKFLPDTTKYQSDWSQNDENQIDFVKNRTHYVEKDVVILPETTVDISSEISIIENPFIVLESNKTYTVIYDGTEYECVCSKVHFSSQSTLSVSDIDDMYYLGNSSIVGISDVDTSEPFLYVFSMSGQDSILYLRDTGTHEIQIKNITEIKSFDVTTDNVSFNHPFLYCPKLTIGQEYTVVWDNVEYKCVALDENAEQQTLYVSPDIIIGLGNKYMLNEDFEDTGEPFFFYFGYFSDGSGTDTSILMAYEGEHSYQIKDVTGVHGFYLNEENSITLSENTVNYNVLNAGKEYDIIINSVTYQSLCQLSGNSYSFEINNLNESLSVENPNYMQIYVNKNGELHINVLDHGLYNIEIVGDIYHKIDKDFIPKEAFVGIPGEGVLSEVFNGGQPSQATGIYSHAEGSNTTASGDSSHAEGSWTIASGSYSHAEGITTTASGSYSHAEGRNTTASGKYGAHAEGGNTTASGMSSHAEGYNTRATGKYSHSEGYTTEASGNYSHAEGSYALASGENSHAEGYITESKGIKSHAEGDYTIASGESQHVQGKYNIEDTSNKYSHIVGNGSSHSKRSNAHTVDWSGNAWYQGDIYVGGSGQTDENAKKIATEEYVDTASKDFIVNFELTDNEDYTGYNVTTSTTFDEVYSAIQEGKTVIGHATFGAITCVLHAETIKSSRVCFVCIDENLRYEHITKLTIEMSAYYDAVCSIHNLVAYSDNNSIEATAIILKSPNGTYFSITIGDDGVLTASEITE